MQHIGACHPYNGHLHLCVQMHHHQFRSEEFHLAELAPVRQGQQNSIAFLRTMLVLWISLLPSLRAEACTTYWESPCLMRFLHQTQCLAPRKVCMLHTLWPHRYTALLANPLESMRHCGCWSMLLCHRGRDVAVRAFFSVAKVLVWFFRACLCASSPFGGSALPHRHSNTLFVGSEVL